MMSDSELERIKGRADSAAHRVAQESLDGLRPSPRAREQYRARMEDWHNAIRIYQVERDQEVLPLG